jgi:SAM-dependent methyltransferase
MRLTQREDWTGRPSLKDGDTARRVFAREQWMQVIRDTLPPTRLDLLELGCSPGFLGAVLMDGTDWVPFGVDYADDADEYRTSFEQIGKAATLYQGDLFQFAPDREFDVVCSFGLVEHFRGSDLNQVLAIHHKFVRPGGYVVILLPNFTGVQYLWHYLFDRPSLDTHNVGTMNLELFRPFDELGYDIMFKDYHGHFRVWGNSGWVGTWFTGKAVAALSHLISKTSGLLAKFGLRLSGRSLSPYILFIGRRPGSDAS